MFKDILVKPITEAPLEILIAEEYANNPKEFKQKAKMWVKDYAMN